MKIRLLSDVHLEFLDARPGNVMTYWRAVLPPMDEDAESALVIAGDFCVIDDEHMARIDEVLRDASQRFAKVIYVFGNHEYYHQRYDEVFGRIAAPSNVSIATDECLSLQLPNGAACHVVTLWTDFNGSDWASMNAAQQYMNDYRLIRDRSGKPITPLFLLNKHAESLRALRAAITPRSIVVTHHLPSRIAVHERFKGNPQAELLNGAYASSLEALILDTRPQAWFFGHTHTSFDGMIGATRLITNPVGYPTRTGPENESYNPSFQYEYR